VAGKTALVVGGTSGIGRATAELLAAAGAVVTVAGRRGYLAHEVAATLADQGRAAHGAVVDVTSEESVRDLVDSVVERHGGLDIAFNAAGSIGRGRAPLHRVSEEAWADLLETNLTGCWRCLKHESMAMVGQRSGSIINCSSVLGLGEGGAVPGLTAYTAAKYGIVGMTKVAAAELAAKGVRVNAVCPALVPTDMLDRLVPAERRQSALGDYPMKRMGTAQEIASVVLFLASQAASYITGQAIAIDGGYAVR
jgi:NAD(P)-dependent dehydrogenase (short-subunit alcohol dehydrogenase family)